MPDWTATLVILALALSIGGLANWQLRRPYDLRWIKLAPWTGIQFLAVLIALLMFAHIMTLLTGRPFGRGN